MFQKNEEVKWSSQAGGHVKVKQGKVLAVLSPGIEVNEFLASQGLKPIRKPGKARQVISYLIQVGSKIYWPNVKALASFIQPQTEQTQETTTEQN